MVIRSSLACREKIGFKKIIHIVPVLDYQVSPKKTENFDSNGSIQSWVEIIGPFENRFEGVAAGSSWARIFLSLKFCCFFNVWCNVSLFSDVDGVCNFRYALLICS